MQQEMCSCFAFAAPLASSSSF